MTSNSSTHLLFIPNILCSQANKPEYAQCDAIVTPKVAPLRDALNRV